MNKIAAVIVAGGSGSRMGTKVKKQYLKLKGKEILTHTVERFSTIAQIEEIIVVTGEEDIEYVTTLLRDTYKIKKVKAVVAGGKERQDSCWNGISNVSEEMDYIMVHDGARPLISEAVINASIEKVKECRACIVAVPVKDTIKQADQEGKIINTPRRETLWAVQTPQVFEKGLLINAYQEAYEKALQVTDDSMIVEAFGEAVHIVQGEYTNIKITTPEDLLLAERLI
ncbi:2-C-methyl-D-erythritol 4-phosphate cytidylyltransferase [Niameybacter massiliensis]|uniref:2-C-methyl-D-erythritol 4-phosphate cytidylyltransferase n=1 Tax=Niameybacter massiliensis TaxID=1658108 RepID=UPI0006B628D6|nr:2-C-methyl-D-erythritol 4-phosphate cytidylyltransferase [Niameybacter massiliensis]